MTGGVLGFILWVILGCFFIGNSIRAFNVSKKPVGFWANMKMFEVTDIKKYNRAVGKLFCAYGMVLVILGIPLLAEQNSAWIVLSIVGVMLATIAAMVIYTVVIENKYKKKQETE